MSEERSFKPTKKKLERARREGQVLRSPYLTQSVVICAGISAAWVISRRVWVAFQILLECVSIDSGHGAMVAFTIATREVLLATSVVGGTSVLAAVLAEGLQVGVKVESSVIAPRWDRLNFSHGVCRIIRSAPKQIGLLCFRALVLFMVLGVLFSNFSFDTSVAMHDLAHAFGKTAHFFPLLLSVGILASLALAACDYLVKRRSYLKDLSMSRTELRDEMRDDEGNPQVKAARRSLYQTLALQDLARRVRKSKVIVVQKFDAQQGDA